MPISYGTLFAVKASSVWPRIVRLAIFIATNLRQKSRWSEHVELIRMLRYFGPSTAKSFRGRLIEISLEPCR